MALWQLGGSGWRRYDADDFYHSVVASSRLTTLYGVGLTELYYRTPYPEYVRLVACANSIEEDMHEEV